MTIAPGLPRCPTVVHALAAAVAQVPCVPALVCDERRLSYAELGRAVSGMGRVLAALGARAERVVVLLPASLEAVVSALAVLAARAQLTAVDPASSAAELESILNEAQPRLIVCDATSVATLAELESRRALPRRLLWGSAELPLSSWLADAALDLSTLELPTPDELALLIFTRQGGAPLGAEHAHRGIALSLAQHCTRWPVAAGRDRFLDVTPLCHAWGLVYATFVPIYARSTRVLVPTFDPERVLATIEQQAITVLGADSAAPYRALLASPRRARTRFSSLRHSLSGSAPAEPEPVDAWQQCTGRPVLTGWGKAEGSPLCLSDARGPSKRGSVGRAAPLTEITIVDSDAAGCSVLPANQAGRVRVRGPQLMLGYRSRPQETRNALRDGWLYTGDTGYLDEDGHLFLIEPERASG